MNVFINRELLPEFISRSSKVAVIGHTNPDGDCIGSVTAMAAYLESLGKEVTMVTPTRHPDFLNSLVPEGCKVWSYIDETSECDDLLSVADLFICLDFNRLSRIDEMGRILEKTQSAKVLIDHHLNPESGHFDIVISETEISSACELLYQTLLQQPGIDGDVAKLPKSTAVSLYAGMMTDTNNFANSVFPGTFGMASALLAAGVDKMRLQNEILCSYSENRMRLMGKMLLKNMKLVEDGKVAYMILSLKDKEKYNYATGDSEGFVNLPLSVKGVVMTALFTQNEENIRVSLRSKGNLDVNLLAGRFFNGGGHKNASGGRLNVTLDEVGPYFEKSVREYFSELGL